MNGRRKQLARAKVPYDLASPPAGVKLNLGVVAARLRVTISDMADAARISRTAIADLLSNKWPVRADRGLLSEQLWHLMADRQATEEELRTLFHAHQCAALRTGNHAPTGPDARAPALPDYDPAAPRKAAPAFEEDPMLLLKQSLTMQARRAFRLFTNPFDQVTSEEAMFCGDDIAYVREVMWQCAQQGGFVALVGESGAGKTTLMQDFMARLERDASDVTLIAPGVLGMEGNDRKGKAMKSADILHAIVTRLDSNAPVAQTMPARTVQASKLLTSSAQAGNKHLLVVEEAHSMPDVALKHLKRLHELRLGRRPLLGILLLAQPELKTSLAEGLRNGTLREVAQRVEIVELLPLDDSLKAYLAQRTKAVGRDLAELMDDSAIEQLRERLTFKRGGAAISMCYPLAVNNLVTKALNVAAELGAPLVTRQIVSGC